MVITLSCVYIVLDLFEYALARYVQTSHFLGVSVCQFLSLMTGEMIYNALLLFNISILHIFYIKSIPNFLNTESIVISKFYLMEN